MRERELIFLLSITRNFMASVRRGSLSLLVLRVGCVIVSCSYNYLNAYSCNYLSCIKLGCVFSIRKCTLGTHCCLSRRLKYIRITCPCNEHPLTPHFYIEKVGFTRVYIFFLIFAPKHRLWVLVRTASVRRF